MEVRSALSPRTGRPKLDNPKVINVKVRLTDETAKRLDEYCAEHGITRTEAIRTGIQLLLDKE